jgi:iron complex outermembrane receptor protein
MLGSSTLLFPAIAAAQTAGAGAVPATQEQAAAPEAEQSYGDIVVTAQKRSESLQKVPLAVTAVTADTLANTGITNLQAVTAIVPNLNIGQQQGVAKVALRGIGLENISAGAEGSIALHLDGVFVSRSIVALSSFYDVEQIEVLRGPQGTLYGRNATGGSINITTRKPTEELSGYGTVTFGNYGRVESEGAISGAIVPGVLLGRIAFQTANRDGYGRNIVTGNDIDNLNTQSIRGKLLFQPADRFTFELTADYHREQDRAGGYHYLGAGGFSAPGVSRTPTGIALGGEVASNVRDIASEVDPNNHVRFWGVSGRATYQLSDDIELRSLTAYRDTKYVALADLDSTSLKLAPKTNFENDTQFSQELQLSGKMDRLNWLLGAFYFHENDQGGIRIPLNNVIVGGPGNFVQGYFSGGAIKTDAFAIFGQASYEIFDDFRVTLGARYSSEKKTNRDEAAFDTRTPYDPDLPLTLRTLNRSTRFKSFTPRIALDYQVTPDILLYASWSKGFKAGTYNLGALQDPVRPEKVSAFEGGIKSKLFNRNVRFNLAGFHYNYKDLQIGKVVGASLLLENAATATIYGLEAELQARVGPRIELNANGAWLHARFDRYISADPARPFGDGITTDPDTNAPAFNLAGNSLSQSPNFTFFVGAQYRLPTNVGDFTLRGEVAWRDRIYFTPFNRQDVSQASNTKLNAFLNWKSMDEKWNASIFVKNIANKTIVGNSYVSSGLVGFPINGYLEEPRTYGAKLGFKF